MKTVLITGANAGLGYESARQLASVDGVEKVILACRSPDKAEAAKASLEESTGKTDFYQVLIMDVSKLDSVRKAVDELDTSTNIIDGLLLNAGGGGGATPAELTEAGVTAIFAANVLGHVLLVDLLLEKKKITSGGSVVYSGSEGVRGISTLGMPPVVLKDHSVEEIVAIADGSRFSPKEQNFNDMYPITKFVATLWMGAMARKGAPNNIRFVTMSPGMTSGTNVADKAPAIQQFIFKWILYPVLGLFGNAHGPAIGAKRYLDALLDEKSGTFKSGRFYATKGPGASGEVGDQETFTDVFYNEDYQNKANEAIHKFIK